MRFSFKRKTWNHLRRSFTERWRRWQHIMFLSTLIAALVAGGVLWYWSLYVFHWTDEERTAYVNSKVQAIWLNESRFSKVIDTVNMRQERYNILEKNGRDIFQGK